MAEALLDTECSQLFIPPFIKKLAAVTDNLEVVAAATKRYNDNHKKGDSLPPVRVAMVQLDEAVQHFAYLDELQDLEHAEL